MLDLDKVIKKRLPANRYYHSVAVARSAVGLAHHYGQDSQVAEVAGMLHDYARDLDTQKLVAIAKEQQLITHPVEYLIPVVLHAPVGAFLVARDLAIKDKRVLRAIRYHTVGAADMTDLEKIVFLADLVEPSRRFPGVEDLRQMVWEDLNKAMLLALDCTIMYVLTKGQPLHPHTVEARNALLGVGLEGKISMA